VQQLHLVGVTTDNDNLIFSVRKGAKSGSFVLPLDEALLLALADAVRRRSAESGDLDLPVELDTPAPTPRRQSQLSPREIQDRLRAGRSLEEIAAVAGVGEEWVARFSAPVEAERSQIVQRARQLTYPKPRRGDSAEPLGLSVRWNLAERGVRLTNDEFDAAWSGYQVTDETWMVTFAFVSRKRDQAAEWELDLLTNELVGRNRLASDLGYVESGRRRRSMASLQPATPAVASRRSDRSTPAPALADPPPAIRSTKPKSKPKPRTTSAPTRRVGVSRPGTRATAVRKTVAKKTAAKKTVAKKTSSAKRAAPSAKKASPAKRGRTSATAKKKVPPAPPIVVEKDAPNELGLRRLQLVSETLRSTTPSRPRPGAPSGRSQPAVAPAVRIAAVRSADVIAARPASPPRPPQVAVAPIERPERPELLEPSTSDRPPSPSLRPEAGLDVVMGDMTSDFEEEAAEARRAVRRRARAAARGGEGPNDDASDDGPVVTIRANRATPPTGESTGDVVIPGDRPSLRPAQPAAQPAVQPAVQPGRRRYSRARSR